MPGFAKLFFTPDGTAVRVSVEDLQSNALLSVVSYQP